MTKQSSHDGLAVASAGRLRRLYLAKMGAYSDLCGCSLAEAHARIQASLPEKSVHRHWRLREEELVKLASLAEENGNPALLEYDDLVDCGHRRG